MRDFTIQEIKTYALRAQAAIALRAAINALEGLTENPILTDEEQGSVKEYFDRLCELENFNYARIKTFEEAMENFQTIRPSMRAMAKLVELLEGIKSELEPTDYQLKVPIATDLFPPKSEGEKSDGI